MKRIALLLVATALLAASCSGDDDPVTTEGAADEGITVFADTSLSSVFQQLAPDARFVFADSAELRTRLEDGEAADVYAVAGPNYSQGLDQDAIIETPQVFAMNRLVLVVPAGNPAGIESLDDVGADATVAAGVEGSALREYTHTVLDAVDKAGLVDAVAFEGDGPAIIDGVASGEADAGFVYFTDAKAAGDDVDMVELPAQALLQYPIAVVTTSEKADDAEAFVELVLGDAGRQALEGAGFGTH